MARLVEEANAKVERLSDELWRVNGNLKTMIAIANDRLEMCDKVSAEAGRWRRLYEAKSVELAMAQKRIEELEGRND